MLFLQIIIITNLQVHQVNQKYNKGNVKFELLVKENTEVQTHGSYKLDTRSSYGIVQEMTITEAYEAINQCISKLKFFLQNIFFIVKAVEFITMFFIFRN